METKRIDHFSLGKKFKNKGLMKNSRIAYRLMLGLVVFGTVFGGNSCLFFFPSNKSIGSVQAVGMVMRSSSCPNSIRTI
jgi:hypothetical protein